MAKKKTSLHNKHISTKWGIGIITAIAFILSMFVFSQYNQQQNLFSNAAPQDATVKGKIYSIFPNHCLTAPKGSKSGDKVVIQACKNGDPNQLWERSGGVVDRLYKNNGLCLGTDKMATTTGTPVEVVDCGNGNSKAERWAEIDENGTKNNGGVFKLHGIDEWLTAANFDVKDGNTLIIKSPPKQGPIFKSQEWHFLQLTSQNTSGGNGGGGNSGGGNNSGGNNPGGGNVIGTACTTPYGSGTCQYTSTHSSGGTYYPGYCPGASNIQCWVSGGQAYGNPCSRDPHLPQCPPPPVQYTCFATGGTCVPKNTCGGITPCTLTGGTCQPGFVCNKNTSGGGGGSSSSGHKYCYYNANGYNAVLDHCSVYNVPCNPFGEYNPSGKNWYKITCN